jgi:hypothetical protein
MPPQNTIGSDLLMPQPDEIFAKGTPKGTLKLPFFLARGLGISTNSGLAAQDEFCKCICVRNFTCCPDPAHWNRGNISEHVEDLCQASGVQPLRSPQSFLSHEPRLDTFMM